MFGRGNVNFNGQILNYEDLVENNVHLFTAHSGESIKFFVDLLPLDLRRELEFFVAACGGEVVVDSWLITNRTVIISQTSNLGKFDRPVFSPHFIVDCLKKRELLDLKPYVQNESVSDEIDVRDVVFHETSSFLGLVHLQNDELTKEEKLKSLRYIRSKVPSHRLPLEPVETVVYSSTNPIELDEKIRKVLNSLGSTANTCIPDSPLRPTLNLTELVEEFELYLEAKNQNKLRSVLNFIDSYGDSSDFTASVDSIPELKSNFMRMFSLSKPRPVRETTRNLRRCDQGCGETLGAHSSSGKTRRDRRALAMSRQKSGPAMTAESTSTNQRDIRVVEAAQPSEVILCRSTAVETSYDPLMHLDVLDSATSRFLTDETTGAWRKPDHCKVSVVQNCTGRCFATDKPS